MHGCPWPCLLTVGSCRRLMLEGTPVSHKGVGNSLQADRFPTTFTKTATKRAALAKSKMRYMGSWVLKPERGTCMKEPTGDRGEWLEDLLSSLSPLRSVGFMLSCSAALGIRLRSVCMQNPQPTFAGECFIIGLKRAATAHHHDLLQLGLADGFWRASCP